jgi:O-antigen ligase
VIVKKINKDKKRYSKFIQPISILATYFIVSIVYCVLIVLYFYQIGFLTEKVNINLYYSHLTNQMWSINQHPIYASIFIAIAILFGIKLLCTAKGIYKKSSLIIGLTLQFSMLLFLSRKGVLLALGLSFISFFFYQFKTKNQKLKLIISLVAVSFMMFLASVTQKRFKEVFNSRSYSKIESTNSTSIRFGIYKCVYKIIKENPILGHGIGDVKNKLKECYTNTSGILLKENYNSHNQYLSIWLSNGIVGFIIFILFLLINYKKAINKKNHLFLSLLIFFTITMLFENILERQSGVILFSLAINFFGFINIENDRKKLTLKS